MLSSKNDWNLELTPDKGNWTDVILMDLSRGFDMINHSLLLFKLEIYVVSENSLKLMQIYLCSRFQRTRWNGSF